jgi:hypothetical protein
MSDPRTSRSNIKTIANILRKLLLERWKGKVALGLRVDVAQEWAKWPDPVYARNFSTSWETVSFSRKSLLDGAGRSVGTLTGWTVGRSAGRLNGYAFRKLTTPAFRWMAVETRIPALRLLCILTLAYQPAI